MTFISYAQNFEDVMLWRALKYIKKGFYIDIGAAWPDYDSVTKLFYDSGWSGINIEPNPTLYAQLEESRPIDTNLLLAVSDREDHLTMNILGDSGLSTLDNAIAERHHQQVGWSIEKYIVQVTTLNALWQRYVPADKEVHFLKIDVEGSERAVLAGNDWIGNRPWIVVVEATVPMTREENHEEWESLLLTADYQFVYADGLNRFYIAKEQEGLLPAFRYPPNVFDEFLLVRQQQAETRATEAESRATETESRAAEAEAHATAAEARITDLLNSASWRITAPLRWGKSLLVRASSLPDAAKHRAKMPIRGLALYVGGRPALRKAALAVLDRFPDLKHRLMRIVYGSLATPGVHREKVPTDLADLSPHARRIHGDLKAAVERRRKGGD
uniref:Methyltransferase, FkbM family n=1 Tax=Candidatus Kentrum sp. TC TaxID=2126339 RepID=A0A450YEJ7_9GAMM|nr:MAG: methyltransferase, FkbM family [Candidatus Kentron sp. TC]